MSVTRHDDTFGPNLSSITFIGRQVVKFGLIGILLLMVGRFLLSSLVMVWRATHPAPPPPPSVGFGLLPPLLLPEQTSDGKPKTYTLETKSGSLPVLPTRARVYLVTKTSPSLLDDQTTREAAAQLGFVFEPDVLDERTYRFTQSKAGKSTLTIDKQTKHFSLQTDFFEHPELLLNNQVPDRVKAVETVKSLVAAAGTLPADLATVSGETRYLKSFGNELTEAISFSDADLVQVDLRRAPLEGKYEAFTAQGRQGTVHAIVHGAGSGVQSLVSLDYHHFLLNYFLIEDYPLRSVQMAWKTLQAGEGYIAVKGSDDQAVIRSVSLGYCDFTEYQPYLQPIFVFAGDGGFLGFVPAIDPAYVQAPGSQK